jgi:hypothetical protein
MSIIYRGLNISEPDVTTAEERDAFFSFTDQPTGRPVPSYALLANLRPDALKRQLGHVFQLHHSESFSCPLPYLNLYILGGWVGGVRQMIELCQPSTFISGAGYPRDAVVETIAVSFYLSPMWGIADVSETLDECMSNYREPAPGAPSPFPEEWAVAPDELKAGLDYSTPELTEDDLAALIAWYERVCGEVPASVTLSARYRPQVLKAERNKWEHIVRTGLPNQMFAYLLLHHEVWRRNAIGTRDALLLARGLGVSREQAIDAMWYSGGVLGGTGTLSAVAQPINEILESW